MPRVLLVDGDIVGFVIACRAQRDVDWGDGEKHSYADADEAKLAVTRYLTKLRSDLNADRVIVCMSDPSRRYFRHDVYPLYKAHRTHGTPPVILPQIKQFLRDGSKDFPSKTVLTLEADDVLGILATHPTLVKGEKVIVTSDKDLNQIEGEHHDPMKGRSFVVEPNDAHYFFWTQTLTGDTCDGFPGCPGIGPKKAHKIILDMLLDVDSRTEWSFIVEAYQKKGLTEADALVQARVARILQHTDYDFVNKKVILWNP